MDFASFFFWGNLQDSSCFDVDGEAGNVIYYENDGKERGRLMQGDAYELLALFMRYIFVLIGILILWRAFRWLWRDARAYKKEMRSLPDAGLIGEIVELSTGKRQPLPREGMMGSSRFCDIRVKGAGVKRCHALFALEEGKGLQIVPQRGSKVLMAGVMLNGPAHALHGTELQLGETALRVRLFAGLKVPHPSQFQMDQPVYEQEEDAPWADLMESAPQPFEGYPPPARQAPEMAWEEAPAYAPPVSQPPPMPAQPAWEEEDEGIPYASPLPQRRRRSGR